jgi:hypothetical protein
VRAAFCSTHVSIHVSNAADLLPPEIDLDDPRQRATPEWNSPFVTLRQTVCPRAEQCSMQLVPDWILGPVPPDSEASRYSRAFMLDSACYNCEVRQKRIVPVVLRNVMVQSGKIVFFAPPGWVWPRVARGLSDVIVLSDAARPGCDQAEQSASQSVMPHWRGQCFDENEGYAHSVTGNHELDKLRKPWCRDWTIVPLQRCERRGFFLPNRLSVMRLHLSHFLMDFGLALNKLMLSTAGGTDREAIVITQEMSEQTMRSSFVPIFSAFSSRQLHNISIVPDGTMFDALVVGMHAFEHHFEERPEELYLAGCWYARARACVRACHTCMSAPGRRSVSALQ